MNDLKPIETVYNGYRFRSRLEARWAVFFDVLNIQYEYELEGFELPEQAGRYLPDFWLPQHEIHVEVKPHHDLSRSDIRKLVLFAADGDSPTLLIVGSPTAEHMYLLGRGCLEGWHYFAEEYDNDEPLLRALFWEQVQPWAHVQFGYLPRLKGIQLLYRTVPPQGECAMESALVKAKQARFEHGRHGN